MANHLEALAWRLEDDPFFLACPLKLFAQSEALNDERLAAALGCSRATLTPLRLCRAPMATGFQQDIDRIAARFQLVGDALAEAVRRGQAIWQLSRPGGGRTLLAARDGEENAHRGNP